MKKLLIIPIFIIVSQFAYSQALEDGLRLANSNGMITPRVAGLNVAYNGVVDDIGALLYNPAGLAWIGNNEVSFGFGFSNIRTEVDFLDYKNEISMNNAYLSHFGMSVPFKAGKRPGAIGFGYFQESDYDNYIKFSGMNPSNTMLDYEARNGSRNYDENFATFLALADKGFNTPVKDSLYQSGVVEENGGMRNLTGAASFEVSDFVSVGFGLAGKFGSYNYYRKYEEYDSDNRYNTFKDDYSDIDFKRLTVKDNKDQEISGITGNIGILAKYEDFVKLSITIQFPTWYQINETRSRTAYVDYDNGDTENEPYHSNGERSYNVTTPFIYKGGLSFNAKGITFAAGIEYTDVTQMNFSDATFGSNNMDELNSKILDELTGQVKWGFGMEYDIPLLPFVVRGSFSKATSPYGDDIANANRESISLGGGVMFGDNIRVDCVFNWQELAELRSVYGNPLNENSSSYTYNRKPFSVGLQMTYRY
jgi:hypothetical protein